MAVDYAHEETDRRLAAIEKRVAEVYKKAVEEMRQKLADWYAAFEKEDTEKAALVEKGELKKKAYLAWRKDEMMEGDRLKAMAGTLAEDFTNSDKIAMKIVRDDLEDVYALNANYSAYEIEKNTGANLSWTLYDHDTVERIIRDNPDLLPLPEVNIPLDRRWNKGHVNNAILQGILQGDSIPKIAQRLENILGMDHRAAVRSARTATTAAECAGRLDTYKYAESLGIKLQKQWLATLDDRTRHAHRQLDGQTVDIGKNFEIDGYELEYPGDPKAPGYLIYNCRCTTITIDKFHDKNAPRASKLKDVTYDEWKEGQNGKPNRKWGVLGENPQKTVEKAENSGIMKIGLQFFANKSIAKQSERQLKKSIASWKANVDKHMDKVKHPEIYDIDWNSKDERQKSGLINHWKKEIRTLENNINDAETELRKRRDNKNE